MTLQMSQMFQMSQMSQDYRSLVPARLVISQLQMVKWSTSVSSYWSSFLLDFLALRAPLVILDGEPRLHRLTEIAHAAYVRVPLNAHNRLSPSILNGPFESWALDGMGMLTIMLKMILCPRRLCHPNPLVQTLTIRFEGVLPIPGKVDSSAFDQHRIVVWSLMLFLFSARIWVPSSMCACPAYHCRWCLAQDDDTIQQTFRPAHVLPLSPSSLSTSKGLSMHSALLSSFLFALRLWQSLRRRCCP